MFTKKPVYTASDLQSTLTGLEKLEQLRDKALTDIRLTPALKDIRQADYDRLTMAIKSRQRLLIYMQESVMK